MFDNDSTLESKLVVARFFGCFTSTVDGRPIAWMRRMDKRIFKFLLLKPDGRASRDELRDVFWNGCDPKSSRLSLRTACCNIRKVLADRVGSSEVAQHFYADSEALFVNLERCNVDVRRYIAHVRSGNTLYATGDLKVAHGHFKRAHAFYYADIGWGDEPEGWLEPLAAECAELQGVVIKRLAELSRESGSTLRTLEYETMLSRWRGQAENTA